MNSINATNALHRGESCVCVGLVTHQDTPDQVRVMFETLARSKTVAFHLTSDFPIGAIMPMLTAALPHPYLEKLFITHVQFTEREVPAFAAAIAQSKIRELHFYAKDMRDASFYRIMDAIDARDIHYVIYGCHAASVKRTRLSVTRSHMKKHVRVLYESLLAGRTDTHLRVFLSRDGDNAIVTRALRYLL